MALEDYFEPFIRMDLRGTPDGMGGFDWQWLEGAAFEAGVSRVNFGKEKIAGQDGTNTVFTIVAEKSVPLEQEGRAKRVKDGRLYRITSNAKDMETPDIAQGQFWQATAEVVEV